MFSRAVSHQCSVSVICADCTVVAGKYFRFSDANHLEHPQDRPERLQGEACLNTPLVASAFSSVRPVFRNAVCLCCALASSVVWLRQCLKFMSRNQAYFAYRWFSWGVASLLEGNSRGPCLAQLVRNTG